MGQYTIGYNLDVEIWKSDLENKVEMIKPKWERKKILSLLTADSLLSFSAPACLEEF